MDIAILQIIIFIIFSAILIIISKNTILNPRSHGFYRWLSWECILLLLIYNYKYWFIDPIGITKITSWMLLFGSLFILIPAIKMLRQLGKQQLDSRVELYKFEKTSKLIVSGIYKYIRHPMYSSLLLLTWGVYFKNTTILLLFIALLSTLFLIITARIEEKENIKFFSEDYKEYMKRSKMFIPFIF